MTTENMTLDNDTRNELANYAVEMLYDHLYDNIMKNLSKLEDNDRYYNWYHGYTAIQLPLFDPKNDSVNYYVHTAASSGSISTQYFGEQFDADKVETGPFRYRINVYPPASVRNNPNVTLHLHFEKVSLEYLERTKTGKLGYDDLSVGNMTVETSHKSINFPAPISNKQILLQRKVIPADVRKQKLHVMPGLRFNWYYSGTEVQPADATFYERSSTRAFVRNYSKNIFM